MKRIASQLRGSGGTWAEQFNVLILRATVQITTDPDVYNRQLILQTTSPNLSPFLRSSTTDPVSPRAESKPARWPELMTISTLAEYLDMSLNSVRKLIENGVLPAATTSPSPRMKRWKRSVIDDALLRIADRKYTDGPSMSDVLRASHGSAKYGQEYA